MKKDYPNKKLKAEESKDIDPPVPAEAKKLICTRECVVPDIGHWVTGDTVTDRHLVKRLATNPNFAVMEE